MLRVSALFLSALALLGVGAAAKASPPQYGSQLYIKATMSLPYAGIVEDIEAWFDGQGDRAKVNYYDGMDSYIFRGDLNVTWQVNPMNNVDTCFATVGAPDIRSYIPDLTGFELQDDAVQINNVMCDSWQLAQTTMGKTSTYNFFTARDDHRPIRYQMMGYDSLLGSHYDLYLLDYQNVTTNAQFATSCFDQPPMQCGNFPGPGATHMNPLDEMDGYFPGDIEADELISPDYADYLRAFGKSYSDAKELRVREMQFKKHSHFVASHQRKYRVQKETYTVALNFLADHTEEELASRRGRLAPQKGGRKGNNAGSYHQRQYYDADLPASVDWRPKGAVNPPQDQGVCGSCWSFGSTGAIEGAYFLKYGKLKVMAEQELMDCSWSQGNNACDGGEDYRAYDWIMQNGGMSFKENYGPYLMADGRCKAAELKPDVFIKSYVNTTEFSVPALMDALASVGPVSVSIDASHPGLSFYTGGVYYDPACGNGLDDLDHSVSAVGYGTENGEDYWIVKNSWSTYWGDGGFIKMSRKNNNCGVATQPTYVVLA